MSTLSINGSVVHYEVLGRGKPIILLHSWLGSWRYWIPTMQRLHVKYRVYALDLFGFGDSAKTPNRYSIHKQQEMLHEFMDLMDIPRVALIGHGLGAMIAARYAYNYLNQRVSRLVLVSAPLQDIHGLATRIPPRQRGHRDESDPDSTIQNITNPALSKSNTERVMDKAFMQQRDLHNPKKQDVREVLLSGQSNSPRETNYLRDQLGHLTYEEMLDRSLKRTDENYQKMIGDVRSADLMAFREAVSDFNPIEFLDGIHQLKVPTMLVHGEDDPLIPPPSDAVLEYITRDTTKKVDSRIPTEAPRKDTTQPIILSNVGHFPMLDEDRFYWLVSQFLESDNFSELRELQSKERWRRRAR